MVFFAPFANGLPPTTYKKGGRKLGLYDNKARDFLKRLHSDNLTRFCEFGEFVVKEKNASIKVLYTTQR